MSKIPHSEKKEVIKLKWYKNTPKHWFASIFKSILNRTNGNPKGHTLRKQDIVLLIEEQGLPDFATKEDYEEYIDDPTITTSKKPDQIKNLNVSLD